jgi:hypothetical protein
MATAPGFAAVPTLYIAQCAAASAGLRDGTGANMVTLLTAGGAGEKIIEITVQSIVTTVIGMVRLFISVDGGTNKRLFDEIPIAVVTGSASVAEYRAVKTYDNLVLPANAILYAESETANAVNIIVAAAQF